MSDKDKRVVRSKRKFIAFFVVSVVLFLLSKYALGIDTSLYYKNDAAEEQSSHTSLTDVLDADSCRVTSEKEESPAAGDLFVSTGYRHEIKGVWSYDKCFPDLNDVQIKSAKKNGVSPVTSRREVARLVNSHKLVDISSSPFYTVDDLSHSMPYLVPEAQHLLNTIGLNFLDSLRMKGLRPHMLVVTSVLRTGDDVRRLRKKNGNATKNSCHCYGTTVDVSYNRFVPVDGHHKAGMAHTRWNETLKQVLSEVLRDLRDDDRCYVKYELKQGCYHLTLR